ncbi:hypothetical protein H4217_008687, partial [Coemansia sp. RSA 1939]
RRRCQQEAGAAADDSVLRDRHVCEVRTEGAVQGAQGGERGGRGHRRGVSGADPQEEGAAGEGGVGGGVGEGGAQAEAASDPHEPRFPAQLGRAQPQRHGADGPGVRYRRSRQLRQVHPAEHHRQIPARHGQPAPVAAAQVPRRNAHPDGHTQRRRGVRRHRAGAASAGDGRRAGACAGAVCAGRHDPPGGRDAADGRSGRAAAGQGAGEPRADARGRCGAGRGGGDADAADPEIRRADLLGHNVGGADHAAPPRLLRAGARVLVLPDEEQDQAHAVHRAPRRQSRGPAHRQDVPRPPARHHVLRPQGPVHRDRLHRRQPPPRHPLCCFRQGRNRPVPVHGWLPQVQEGARVPAVPHHAAGYDPAHPGVRVPARLQAARDAGVRHEHQDREEL